MHVPKDSRDLCIKIPIRTVSELNQREHWAVRAKRNKSQQQAVGLFLNTCKPIRVPADVWLTRIAPRNLDQGNLEASFKHVQDAVAKWLGVDDGDRDNVIWRYDQRKGKPKEYGVIIEIFGSGK